MRAQEFIPERKKKKSSRSTGGYFFPGYGYYGSGESGEGGGDGGGESVNRGMAEGLESLDDLTAAYQHHVELSRKYRKKGNREKDQHHTTQAFNIIQQIWEHPDYKLEFTDDPYSSQKNDALSMKHDSRFNEQGVAEGLEDTVSFREMVDVVDKHYPKYYAELSGSNISDKQFEQKITSAYKKIMQKQGVAEGLQKINWIKPNFDFEWHEVEEQSKMKQVPVDVRQYYQKHFPNKDAWLKAVQNGKAVVVPPDHAYEIRNAPFDKAALQKVLAPTGHEGPIGPAKEKRVNDLFDKGQVEMPIILKTSQGLWLIGGKTRLGTANYVKGLPAKVWLIGGKQGVAEGSDFFAGSKFADEDGNTFSVEKIIAFAKKNPKYFHKDFPLSKIKHDLSWWQGNKERMMNADTSFPLLVIQNDDGHLGVADGLNRMKKAVDVEKKTTIDVYLVPKKDIMKFSEKQGVAENFADGRNPQDKGDAKRHGINTKASVSSLRKTAKQGGRKGQLAHWLANMKSGRAKKK